MTHDNVTHIPPELQDFASLMVEEILAKLRVKINDGGWTIDEQREVLDCIVAEQEVKHRLRADLATLRKQLENAREAEEIANLRDYITNAPPAPSLAAQDGLVEATYNLFWGATAAFDGDIATLILDRNEFDKLGRRLENVLSATKGDKS